MIAQLLGLGGQVVRIDADAVSADKSRLKRHEVPLGRGRPEDVRGGDPDPVKNKRQLVHEGDVEVPLGVLDHLGRLGDPDALRPMDARLDDLLVGRGDSLQGRRAVAGDDLHDTLEGVLAVTWVDPFGRVTEEEVLPGLEPASLLDDRSADLLGHAWVDGGFEDNDGTGLDRLSDQFRRGNQGPQIRPVVLVDRGRDRDNIEAAILQVLAGGTITQPALHQFVSGMLTRGILTLAKPRKLPLVNVEPYDIRTLRGKGQRDGQAHVAQTDNGETLVHKGRVMMRKSSQKGRGKILRLFPTNRRFPRRGERLCRTAG